jgi:nitrite reductase/ring-hydroxylating ferredoxin subunit
MAELFVCKVEEISDGDVRIVGEVGREIGVIMHRGAYYAYRNTCPHQGGPVCEGLRLPQVQDVVDDRGLFVGQRFDETDMHIVCPWHGYEFHLDTGVHVGDGRLKLRKFDVITRDGDVYVIT